ncbi:phosphonate C-P lyase system protein PhnG [Anopheles sinensis]|uniref:Phosphonate C-P lyase system protein PhnG n=1 Tax=Anopheles sinensis TaxID=74873 RepID=A0A084VES2_ANOSI|nr:phosphonate C-P lyase system protein PhnG [Anopheles sinensis]
MNQSAVGQLLVKQVSGTPRHRRTEGAVETRLCVVLSALQDVLSVQTVAVPGPSAAVLSLPAETGLTMNGGALWSSNRPVGIGLISVPNDRGTNRV